MRRSSIPKTISQIYGTGKFNPSKFDHYKKTNSSKKMYLWGIGFFLFAISAAIVFGFYIFAGDRAGFTGDRVSIEITGQENPSPGTDFEYEIRVKNMEDVDIEDLEIFIGFPSSSDLPYAVLSESKKPPVSEFLNTWEMGKVRSKGESVLNVTIRFSGEVGQELSLPIRASFKPKGFSSRQVITKDALFVLGNSVLGIKIEGPDSVALGSEVSFSVNIFNDDISTEDDIRIFLELPEGIELLSFEPNKNQNQDYWQVSSLLEEKEIRKLFLRIKTTPDLGESFVISARAESNGLEISRVWREINIEETKVELSLTVNPLQGSKLQWGEDVEFILTVKNLSTYAMRSAIASVALSGEDFLRPGSFSISSGGYFEGGSVIWESARTPAFESLRPGGSVKLSFKVSVRNTPLAGFSGIPAILARASFGATLLDESISSKSSEILINILSNSEFGASGWFTSPEGIQWGKGAHPPLLGQETQYAILWKIGPTDGALEDLLVTTQLPSTSRWIGESDFSVGEISFDSDTKIVSWSASRVPKIDLPIFVRFMVGVTSDQPVPSAIIGQSKFMVKDALAGEIMEFFALPVNVSDVKQ